MHLHFDPFLLSRIQFAFTMSFHILFPSFTIGLASWLALVEGLWLKTHNPLYKTLYQFWVKIFAVTFGMGVVSGVVLSYELGTNWSGFSAKIGNVLGPLFAFEVLTAFFLESSFLGIMLFGWNRVSEKMHFFSTLIVALGTLISAFWILSANSWMHTPGGFQILDDGVLNPVNWIEIIFNASFPYRFVHMVTASYLTTAFVVGGVAAWYLWKKHHIPQAKIMLSMAMLMAVFVAPLQVLFGDMHGLNTLKHQPVKIAAMEGLWETESGAAFTVFGWPNTKTERTDYAIRIPKAASLILTHQLEGEVKGLKAWPKEERPPVVPVFFAFRIMIAMGGLMVITGGIAALLYYKKRLFDTRWFQWWCMAMTPSGFVAILGGWFVTEIGRQPYIVYGVMRSSEALSPVPGTHVLISLVAFTLVYSFLFGAGIYYILALIRKGPLAAIHGTYGEHGITSAPLLTQHTPTDRGPHA